MLKMIFEKLFPKKEKKETEAAAKKAEAPSPEPLPSKSQKSRGSGVLLSPLITERATALAQNNVYVFRVAKAANKKEIRLAVENLYGVDVLAVRVMNQPAKEKRYGRVFGRVAGYKKALVKVKEGQKIEVGA